MYGNLEASSFDVWVVCQDFTPQTGIHPFLPTCTCADKHLHFITVYWSRAVGRYQSPAEKQLLKELTFQ